jgi:hypothetical protein
MRRPCSTTSTCAALHPRPTLSVMSSTPRASPSRSILFVPPRSSALRASSAAIDQAVPLCLGHPSSCATGSSSTFPSRANHHVVKQRHRREQPELRRCRREPPRRQPASVLLRPHLHHPEHRPDAFPPQHPPASDRRPYPPRRSPLADRRRATATVSLLLPFAPNQGHHRPGSLPGHFSADQRRPAEFGR